MPLPTSDKHIQCDMGHAFYETQPVMVHMGPVGVQEEHMNYGPDGQRFCTESQNHSQLIQAAACLKQTMLIPTIWNNNNNSSDDNVKRPGVKCLMIRVSLPLR